MNKETILLFLKRYPTAIISVVLAVACLIFSFVRGDLSTDLELKETELLAVIKKRDANAKNSTNLKADVEKIESIVERIQTKLFNQEQRAVNTNFFYSFEDLVPIRINSVGQAGVDPPNITAGGAKPLSLYSYMGYDLVVEGTYSDIMRLLNEITHLDAFIRVLGLQIAVTPQVGNVNDAARIRLVVLAQK